MGLISTAAKVAVASSVHGRVQRRQAERWAADQQSQPPAPPVAHTPITPVPQPPLAPPPQAQPPAASGSPSDTDARIAQLKALAELKASGILTDAEFEAEKRKVLQP